MKEYLVFLRRFYRENRTRMIIMAAISFAVLLGLSIAVDIFLPFSGWLTWIRALVLLPFSVVIASIEYMVALYLHNWQLSRGDWLSYRERISLRWRIYISIIAAAFVLVFMAADTPGKLYTTSASLIVSFVWAILAFIRPLQKEKILRELGIPDERDIKYQSTYEKVRQRRIDNANKENQKKNKTAKNSEKNNTTEDFDENSNTDDK